MFQKELSTCAFKIAGGVDLSSSAATSSSRLVKRKTVAPEFTSKITKAFLDSLFAVLDGLVHLASDESQSGPALPPTVSDIAGATKTNPLELVNIQDTVWTFEHSSSHTACLMPLITPGQPATARGLQHRSSQARIYSKYDQRAGE